MQENTKLQGFENFKALETLELSSNTAKSIESWRTVIFQLKDVKTLKKLNISSNQLEDDREIFGNLLLLRNLEDLDVSNNRKLNRNLATYVIEALRLNKSLKYINMSKCNLTYESMCNILNPNNKCQQSPSVRVLQVSENPISEGNQSKELFRKMQEFLLKDKGKRKLVISTDQKIQIDKNNEISGLLIYQTEFEYKDSKRKYEELHYEAFLNYMEEQKKNKNLGSEQSKSSFDPRDKGRLESPKRGTPATVSLSHEALQESALKSGDFSRAPNQLNAEPRNYDIIGAPMRDIGVLPSYIHHILRRIIICNISVLEEKEFTNKSETEEKKKYLKTKVNESILRAGLLSASNFLKRCPNLVEIKIYDEDLSPYVKNSLIENLGKNPLSLDKPEGVIFERDVTIKGSNKVLKYINDIAAVKSTTEEEFGLELSGVFQREEKDNNGERISTLLNVIKESKLRLLKLDLSNNELFSPMDWFEIFKVLKIECPKIEHLNLASNFLFK